jgi:hypothetical protein
VQGIEARLCDKGSNHVAWHRGRLELSQGGLQRGSDAVAGLWMDEKDFGEMHVRVKESNTT